MSLPSLACVLCSREDQIGEEGERGGLSCKDWKSQTSGAELCHFLHGLDEVINLWKGVVKADAPGCPTLSFSPEFTGSVYLGVPMLRETCWDSQRGL